MIGSDKEDKEDGVDWVGRGGVNIFCETGVDWCGVFSLIL